MLSVGYGNGIFFRQVRQDGDLPNFDNTKLRDEYSPNRLIYKNYFQKYFSDSQIIVQAQVGHGDSVTLSWQEINGGTTGNIVGYLPANLEFDSRDFYQWKVDFSTWSPGNVLIFTITNTTTGEQWQSECVKVINEADYYIDNEKRKGSRLLKIEWYGIDYQFGCHFNGTIPGGGIAFVPFILLEASFMPYEPKTESTVYSNQDEVVKLFELVQRTLELQTDALPRYMLEKLTVASAHDYFFINEAAFVREEGPEVVNYQGANTGEIKLILTQVNVLGLNTHDIDFDCDTESMNCKVTNMAEENVGANTSFTIPEDHGLDSITIWYNGGSDILLKFGKTVGGDEIGQARPSASAPDDNITLNVPQDLVKTGTGTLYVTVSGTSVDVDIFVRTIKNRAT
jgi:hypothetical protein